MTLQVLPRQYSYTGNGVTTAFSFPAAFFDEDDLVVTVDDVLQALATDYTVTGVAATQGSKFTSGTVEFLSAPNARVIIYCATPISQGLDLDNVTEWPMASVEDAFDRAAIASQELQAQVTRAPLSPRSIEIADPFELPSPPGTYRPFGWSLTPPYSVVTLSTDIFTPSDIYSPTALNTYSSNLAQKLEWDMLSLYDFLTETMRADPFGVDCWEAIQNACDYVMSHQPTGASPMKKLRFNGYMVRCGQQVVVTGLDVGDIIAGRLILCEGGLIAPDSWFEDQSDNPSPMLVFGANSLWSGIDNLTIDLNGVCSGVCGDTTDGGTSKFIFSRSRIINFANPEAMNQTDLYGNCTSIKGHSLIPVRKYEIGYDALAPHSWKVPHPYGLRIGPLDVSDDTISSATSKIDGMDIRQWGNERAEKTSYQKRTGIGISLSASDCALEGARNNVADCLQAMCVEGHSNHIKNFHGSPTGGNTEYDTDDGPESDILCIDIENRSGMNYFQGIYCERILWCHSGKAEITDCHFPRNTSSTDGNDTAIILDANAAGDSFDTNDKLLIKYNKKASSLTYTFKYREAGGFTWSKKLDLTQVHEAEVLTSGQFTLASNSGDAEAGNVLSSHATASRLGFRAQTSTKNVAIGIDTDKLTMECNDVQVASVSETMWNFRKAAGVATSLQNGNTEFLSASNKLYQDSVQVVVSRQYLATQADRTTNVTLASVFTNITLVSGKKYRISAILDMTLDGTGGLKLDLAGGAVTATTFKGWYTIIKNSDGSVLQQTRVTALGTAVTYATETAVRVKIEATLLVNAGGTFNLRFAETVSNLTSSILVGSEIEVVELS